MSIQKALARQLIPFKKNLHNESELEKRHYNRCIYRLRKSEYPMLKDTVYLDNGGTTVAARSLIDDFASQMKKSLLSNPHSDAGNESSSASMIADTRNRVLQFFNADPLHFDVVFTANATAAIKLVGDGFSSCETGFDYYFHYKCHTSLLGLGQLAGHTRCLNSNQEVTSWISSSTPIGRASLFAYPAQSNMDGERLPTDWPAHVRSSSSHRERYTLLDAAAFVPTSPMDLSDHNCAPDFIALSFYKIFGFPDLGALIVRKASAHVLKHKLYFGGGTTEMIAYTDKLCVIRKESSPHDWLEDGTTPIRNILALRCAIKQHENLYKSMTNISNHTTWLAHTLYKRLAKLQHDNGLPICHFYTASSSCHGDAKSQGATLALNFKNRHGTWLGCWHVAKMLKENKIHVRAGSHCNPVGAATALEIDPSWLQGAYEYGFRCNSDKDIWDEKPVGMVRITFGAMNTMADVDALLKVIEEKVVNKDDAGWNAYEPQTRLCGSTFRSFKAFSEAVRQIRLQSTTA